MMMGHKEPPKQETKSARTAAREAFFLEFAHETRKRFPSLILMLTGGFRTRAGALSAIRDNACDLIGIGRPSAVDPKLPLLMLDESVADEEAGLPLVNVPVPFYVKMLPARSVGGGLESVCFFLFFFFLLFFLLFFLYFFFCVLYCLGKMVKIILGSTANDLCYHEQGYYANQIQRIGKGLKTCAPSL